MISCVLATTVLAIKVNDDGHELILQARQAYRGDVWERPLFADEKVLRYIHSVVKRLTPKHKSLPKGISLSVKVIDSAVPELFSYVDGHIVMSMRVVCTMKNEAQLAGVLSHELAKGYYIGMYQQVKAYKTAIKLDPKFAPSYKGLGELYNDWERYDVQRALGTGGSGMQIKTLVRQVFTLEDVNKGLAYFSVKQKSLTKIKSKIAGNSETKISGKGDAIFDLKAGMWLEVTEKSKAEVKMSGMGGMGDMSSDMKIVSKYEMELR